MSRVKKQPSKCATKMSKKTEMKRLIKVPNDSRPSCRIHGNIKDFDESTETVETT